VYFRFKLEAGYCGNTELGGFISWCIQVICIPWTQFCYKGVFFITTGFQVTERLN